MEDSLRPCPRAAAQMRVFDELPPRFRAFLTEYPRGLKASAAARLLAECGGDVDEAMHEIKVALPARRVSGAVGLLT